MHADKDVFPRHSSETVALNFCVRRVSRGTVSQPMMGCEMVVPHRCAIRTPGQAVHSI